VGAHERVQTQESGGEPASLWWGMCDTHTIPSDQGWRDTYNPL
jgi:hypothetical protein